MVSRSGTDIFLGVWLGCVFWVFKHMVLASFCTVRQLGVAEDVCHILGEAMSLVTAQNTHLPPKPSPEAAGDTGVGFRGESIADMKNELSCHVHCFWGLLESPQLCARRETEAREGRHLAHLR